MITFYGREPHGWGLRMHLAHMNFPGGETHLKIPQGVPENSDWYALLHGADPEDLVTLGMWADIAKSRGRRAYALIPYLPGARADRGEPFGAKVYANIINGFELDGVVCLDPHSPVMPSLIKNLIIVDHTDMVLRGLIGRGDFAGVIAPDKGAYDRASNIAAALNVPVFQAGKTRDFATGKLTGFTCEPLPDEGQLLVVDDICDGGGTFMGLATATGLPKERLSLWVTHGVFSGQAYDLANYYGWIACTDSHPGSERAIRISGYGVRDLADRIIPVLPDMLHAIPNT